MALTIIEAAAETRLTTVAAVKAELALTSGADDAYLAALVDQASDAVSSWCNRVLAVETVRETFHPRGSATALTLSRWPVLTVSAVTVNGTAEDVANVEAEDGGLLARLDSRGCRVTWPAGRIAVEYRAGYVMPGESGRTLPHGIERATISLVKALWFARRRDPSVRSVNVDGVDSIEYARSSDRLPPDVEALLGPHRNVVLA